MFNVEAVVLKQLLTIEDKMKVTDVFSCLRKEYFSDAFSSIYVAIQNYYTAQGRMPSLDALKLQANRNIRLSQALAVLDLQHIPDVDIMESLAVLEAEFAQDLTLDLIESEVLRDLHSLDKDSLIDRLTGLAMKVEDEVGHNSIVTNANEIEIFKPIDSLSLAVTLGISNEFEIYSGSLQRGEVLFLGGYRGTGKSLVCSNIQVSQWEMRKIAPYYSLEMKDYEVLTRNLVIMSGISAQSLRIGKLTPEEVQQLLKARASMFKGGIDLYKEYVAKYTVSQMSDGNELERRLREEYEEVCPMPIIYDPTLTIERVEGLTRGLMLKYGEENFELTLLDYINQVRLSGASENDMYDWKPQMVAAKSYKNMCSKLNLGGVAPYQTGKDGEARMSKGILDCCDIAFNLDVARKTEGGVVSETGAIMFDTAKCRAMAPATFISPISWKSLRIEPSANLTREQVLSKGMEWNLDQANSKTSGKGGRKKTERDPEDAKGPPAGANDL